MIDGNATGEVMFLRQGRHKLATASAVVADMLDSIEHRTTAAVSSGAMAPRICSVRWIPCRVHGTFRFKGAQKDVELLPVESLTEPAEGVFVVQTRKLSTTAEMNAAAEKLNARGEVRAAMRIL